jgi:hypothetical protein
MHGFHPEDKYAMHMRCLRMCALLSVAPGRAVFFSSEHPDRLWGQPSFLSSEYHGSLLGIGQLGFESNRFFHLVLKLKIHGAMSVLPSTSTWHSLRLSISYTFSFTNLTCRLSVGRTLLMTVLPPPTPSDHHRCVNAD